jgi:regulator of protease activity HflC (stomatin/prohibitin superfamily)
MFDKLIDFIINQINNIIPCYIVYEYMNGVRFRFGKLHGTLAPGLHFKIPYVDTMMRDNTVDTTMLLPAQSVITKDGKELIVKGSIGYKIFDVAKFFCNVYDTRSALSDRTCVIIRAVISECTFEQVKDVNIDAVFLKLAKKAVKDYGIEVQYVSLIDITNSRSYRLFNENIPLTT